jgi:hypothetical protein
MEEFDQFDFWYAVNNTEVVKLPSRQLETFGTTAVNYILVSELMDSVNKIRVREGRLDAARPTILTPGDLGTAALDGFSDAESEKYIDWLSQNDSNLRILQYGFGISKQGTNDYIVSDAMGQVIENVEKEMRAKDDPLSSLIIGVEQPWEVCLLKLMVDMVEYSVPHNMNQLKAHGAFPQPPTADEIRRDIDQAFLEAARNPDLISALHDRLVQAGIFPQYEDRFFALVRSSKKK